MTTENSRPWYIHSPTCDEWRRVAAGGDDLQMLKSLKLIRSIIVNVGIILLGYFSIINGGAPTIIGFVSLAVLGGYNGLEFGDYLALVRAYHEVSERDAEDAENDSE